MTEIDEITEWVSIADSFVISIKEDKISDTLVIASLLRETYLQGKKMPLKNGIANRGE